MYKKVINIFCLGIKNKYSSIFVFLTIIVMGL